MVNDDLIQQLNGTEEADILFSIENTWIKNTFSILGLREPLLMNILEDEECDSKQHALVQYFIKVSIF